MFIHYLKVAFRNLWKYKTQSLISIIGLAVGFTCFALSSLWIRYEKSYDTFYKNADRIYMIREIDQSPADSYSRGISRNLTPDPLGNYLEQNFPEIENVTQFYYNPDNKIDVKYNEHSFPVQSISVHRSFAQLFDLECAEGDFKFLETPENGIAITEKAAKKIFGKESVLGQTLVLYDNTEYTVNAVIKDFVGPSNFTFDALINEKNPQRHNWNITRDIVFVKLIQHADIESFEEKLKNINIFEIENMQDGSKSIREYNLAYEPILLSKIRSDYPFDEPEVKQNHIRMFALSGIVLIICSLFNFLTLFISRFRIRQKEFAIRIVNGSSLLSLFTLLIWEFIVVLILALSLGIIFIQISLPTFRLLSDVRTNLSAIYGESFIYIGGIILVSILVFFLSLLWFWKRTLSSSVRKSNNHIFREVSIALQLIISIGFIFCTSVMQKQLRHLYSVDIGFDYKNIGQITMYPYPDFAEWKSQIQQIPGIKKVVAGDPALMPANWLATTSFTDEQDGTTTSLEFFSVSEDYFDLYNLRLVEGAFPTNEGPEKSIVITEAMVRILNLQNPVGEKINDLTVKGVVKDIHNASPLLPAKPIYFTLNKSYGAPNILIFSYEGCSWAEMKERIEKWHEEYHSQSGYTLENAEETYHSYFYSEEALLKLLGFMSFVCIVISVFGFISLVALTCEERRKEIAIRKVNGAEVPDILMIFFKEYFLLLGIGAVIAFPIGYYIMKRWIEHYTLQTAISVWIYIAILLLFALLIALCIGFKVLKTARENPADVLKTE